MQSRAVLLVIFSATIVLGHECVPAQHCYEKYIKSAIEQWPSTKEELKEMCTDLGIVMDCLMPHLGNCPNFTIKAFDVLEKMQIEICDESSSTAKGYLQHSRCLRLYVFQMRHCTSTKMKKRRGAYCDIVTSIFQCADEFFGQLCGADATQFAKHRYAVNFKPMCPNEVKDYLLPPSSASSLKYAVNPVFMSVAVMLWIRL